MPTTISFLADQSSHQPGSEQQEQVMENTKTSGIWLVQRKWYTILQRTCRAVPDAVSICNVCLLAPLSRTPPFPWTLPQLIQVDFRRRHWCRSCILPSTPLFSTALFYPSECLQDIVKPDAVFREGVILPPLLVWRKRVPCHLLQLVEDTRLVKLLSDAGGPHPSKVGDSTACQCAIRVASLQDGDALSLAVSLRHGHGIPRKELVESRRDTLAMTLHARLFVHVGVKAGRDEDETGSWQRRRLFKELACLFDQLDILFVVEALRIGGAGVGIEMDWRRDREKRVGRRSLSAQHGKGRSSLNGLGRAQDWPVESQSL
jgi:hypothetical protein